LKTEIARTFAALNATNEAILYAKSPEELYRKISEAAFSSGDFLASAIFLLEPGTDLLRFAAGCGDDIARLRSIDISIVAGTPEGSGVCGQAFRDQRVVVSNDYINDTRSTAWRDGAKTGQVGAAAALPLTCNGRSVGATFHYIPLHSSPAGRKYGRVASPMTNTEELSSRLLRLPLPPMSDEEQDMVIEEVHNAVLANES